MSRSRHSASRCTARIQAILNRAIRLQRGRKGENKGIQHYVSCEAFRINKTACRFYQPMVLAYRWIVVNDVLIALMSCV